MCHGTYNNMALQSAKIYSEENISYTPSLYVILLKQIKHYRVDDMF